MNTAYRIDFQIPGCLPTVLHRFTRQRAMAKARSLSATRDCSVYAIATVDGVDTGQRVYYAGSFSHQDDAF